MTPRTSLEQLAERLKSAETDEEARLAFLDARELAWPRNEHGNRPDAALDALGLLRGPPAGWLGIGVLMVPERHGWYARWNCSADGDEIYGNAQIWPFSDPRDEEVPRWWASAKRPDCALVLAALKARQS